MRAPNLSQNRFSSLKTLLMPTKATVPTSESTSQASFSLAGFQVTIIGRFWVTAEALLRTRWKFTDSAFLRFEIHAETHSG
jgi:hypothetical protein